MCEKSLIKINVVFFFFYRERKRNEKINFSSRYKQKNDHLLIVVCQFFHIYWILDFLFLTNEISDFHLDERLRSTYRDISNRIIEKWVSGLFSSYNRSVSFISHSTSPRKYPSVTWMHADVSTRYFSFWPRSDRRKFFFPFCFYWNIQKIGLFFASRPKSFCVTDFFFCT